MMLLYIGIALPTLSLLVSLAVDFGRVQVAKEELHRAADAAALDAAQGVSDGTWLSKAQTAAADNPVDGQTYTLAAGDVTLGNWTSPTFTAGGSPQNAVKVSAHKTAAGGNGIPLLFGSLLGESMCDVHATAIAVSLPGATGSYGLVGVASISLSAGATTDSYNSAAGAYSVSTATANGSVASNGTISVSGNSTTVNGNAFAGIGDSVAITGSPTISGTTGNIASTMNYAAATVPGGSITNYGNQSLSSGTNYLPSGTYEVDNFNMTGGTAIFTGPATIIVNGTFVASGGAIEAYNGLPGNIKFIVLNNNSVTLSGSASMEADMYAPGCNATISGSAAIYGRMVCNSITVSGGSIHYDTSLTAEGTTSLGSDYELAQ
jgi:Flp pilus assembly protein TadG